MAKYTAHPYADEVDFDWSRYDMGDDILDYVDTLRITREFRDAKFGMAKYSSNALYVFFEGDIAASGAVIYDSLIDKYGVASKLISMDRGIGSGKWKGCSRWSGDMHAAVKMAKKYLCPLTDEELVTRTLDEAPREVTEVTAKGKAEKHSVLWAFRYMSETKHAELLKLIPQIVPLVEHMPLRLDLENIHAKWLEAEALSMEAQSVQPWVAVVNRSRNVIHIHRKGDKDEHNAPRVKTLPLTDIPVDIAGKLQVLSMLKAGDTVEGVGCKLSENQYSFILPTVEE